MRGMKHAPLLAVNVLYIFINPLRKLDAEPQKTLISLLTIY